MATEMAEVSNRVNFGSWAGRLTCPEKSGQREYPMHFYLFFLSTDTNLFCCLNTPSPRTKVNFLACLAHTQRAAAKRASCLHVWLMLLRVFKSQWLRMANKISSGSSNMSITTKVLPQSGSTASVQLSSFSFSMLKYASNHTLGLFVPIALTSYCEI